MVDTIIAVPSYFSVNNTLLVDNQRNSTQDPMVCFQQAIESFRINDQAKGFKYWKDGMEASTPAQQKEFEAVFTYMRIINGSLNVEYGKNIFEIFNKASNEERLNALQIYLYSKRVVNPVAQSNLPGAGGNPLFLPSDTLKERVHVPEKEGLRTVPESWSRQIAFDYLLEAAGIFIPGGAVAKLVGKSLITTLYDKYGQQVGQAISQKTGLIYLKV